MGFTRAHILKNHMTKYYFLHMNLDGFTGLLDTIWMPNNLNKNSNIKLHEEILISKQQKL